MIYYRVLVRIGPHEFQKDFLDEAAAISCFDDIAINQDGEIVDGELVMKANAIVDTIVIRRLNDNPAAGKIGDPNR